MRKPKVEFNLNLLDASPLPNSPSLECLVLAAILDQPEKHFAAGMKFLNAKGMFYDLQNDEIFSLVKQHSENGQLSARKVQASFEAMQDNGKLNNLMHICNLFYKPSDFIPNCLLLNEFWIRRTIHRLGYYLNGNALKEKMDALELLGVGSESLDVIYRHIAKMKEVTLSDGISELSREIVAISNSPNGMLGLPSSICELNRRIKGYRKGSLISVGATTGEGKTTLAVQDMRHLLGMGIPVGAFSLEMKISEYVLMMACDKLKILVEDVLDGRLSADDSARLDAYMTEVKKMPLEICDTPAMKIGEIKSMARMWKKNKKIQIIFVDHGHLVEIDPDPGNAEQRFTKIANELKALAKELDIPIVALWQLSRRELTDKNPHKNSDIKYAGGIEQASDVVILIFRPEMHGIETDWKGESTKGHARLIIGKLRLLPKYDVKCRFTGTRFEDLDEFKPPPQPPDNPSAGITPNRDFASNFQVRDPSQPNTDWT